MTSENQPTDELDPVCVSSLRELVWIVGAWTLSFAWVIGYCATFGYGTADEELALILGMPSWVFWGILVPWVAVTIFTVWFALTQMADLALDEETPAELSATESVDGR